MAVAATEKTRPMIFSMLVLANVDPLVVIANLFE
jgi:hypothetical protein